MPQLHEVTREEIAAHNPDTAVLTARRDKISAAREEEVYELAYLRSKEAPRDVKRSRIDALVSGTDEVAVDTTPARNRELQASVDVKTEAIVELDKKIVSAVRKAGNAYCQSKKAEWDKLATEFLADCANAYRKLLKMDKARERLRVFGVGFGGLFNLDTESVFGDTTAYGDNRLLSLLQDGVKLGYIKESEIAR